LGSVDHPLLDPLIIARIEAAASAHRGRRWTTDGFTDLSERAAHPSGILHGVPFSVFAKLTDATDGREQFAAELNGLELITRLTTVRTPTPVATGIVRADADADTDTDTEGDTSTGADTASHTDAGAGAGWLLLTEALPERAGAARTPEDYRAIGHSLAALHQVTADRFGLTEFDGYFGPIPQDNSPVTVHRWAEFYAERRIEPLLRLAVDSGSLSVALAGDAERLISRLRTDADLVGDEPPPSLLHGDAQQNNFICTPFGAAVIDVTPYFGHPEIDLAQLDFFEPTAPAVLDAYRQIRPIDAGFAERRELWRVPTYLAVIAVEGRTSVGRQFTARLADMLGRYA
jgi:protein-ribulosamine 3-kinase